MRINSDVLDALLSIAAITLLVTFLWFIAP